MTNQIQNPNKKYDLIERTALFGKRVIALVKQIPQDAVNKPLISQVVRSATSIGANYMEADAAESKQDFRHKIALCKKESKESMHWLHMISSSYSLMKDECRLLWKEAHELCLIFSSIIKK